MALDQFSPSTIFASGLLHYVTISMHKIHSDVPMPWTGKKWYLATLGIRPVK